MRLFSLRLALMAPTVTRGKACRVVDANTQSGGRRVFRAIDEDANVEVRVVEGFNSHLAAVILWLPESCIPDHARGLDMAWMQCCLSLRPGGVGGNRRRAWLHYASLRACRNCQEDNF